jgi:hypothetical protein
MKWRVVNYYAWLTMSSFKGLLLLFGVKFKMCLGFSRYQYRDIVVINANRAACSSIVFFKRTSAAIDVIKTTDSCRFNRVLNQIRIVVNVKMPLKAMYHRNGRICLVDMTQWPFEKQPEASIKEYACTLVRESTRGRICQNKIPCVKRTEARIEKVCVEEAIRFVRKWNDGSFDWIGYQNSTLRKR